MKRIPKQRGLTLVELLITLVMALTIGGGVVYIFMSTVATHNQTERVSRLEEELAAVMDLMVRDMRRAGYDRSVWNYAISGSTAALTSDFDQIAYEELAVEAVADPEFECFLYRYDRYPENTNGNGVLDTSAGATDERFGFRLNGNQIQKGYGATACNAGTWQSLTSTWAANITDLDYDIDLASVTVGSSSGTATVNNVIQLRAVTVSLTGQAGSGADAVTRTLTETVRLRNDEMNP